MTLDSLQSQFTDDEDWIQAIEDQTDIFFKKFLESSMFISDKKSGTDIIDEDRLTLFAIYSCKEGDQITSIMNLIK